MTSPFPLRGIAFLDFDSTLLNGEMIEIVSKHLKPDNHHIVNLNNQGTVNGTMCFHTGITDSVKTLKGVKLADIELLFDNPEIYTKGAKELIQKLKEWGFITVCLSGGFEEIIKIAQEHLEFEHFWANHLHHCQEGILDGTVSGSMMKESSKGIMVEKLLKLLGISGRYAIAIGDGANDISMFEKVGLSIGFCPSPIVAEKAHKVVEKNDLGEAITIIENHFGFNHT